MDESDTKIRKQWLVMWGLSMIIAIPNVFLQLRFDHSLDMIPLARYWIAACSLLGVLVVGFATYHCIYKKPGTKLLTFGLVVAVVSLPINTILYLCGKINFPDYFPYYRAYLFTTQVMGIWWLVVSWRMRKANKRLQARSRPSA